MMKRGPSHCIGQKTYDCKEIFHVGIFWWGGVQCKVPLEVLVDGGMEYYALLKHWSESPEWLLQFTAGTFSIESL